MGLNSKMRVCYDEEEDRISKLPDNILHRILSFLPTRYAVSTSVLSSSWRNYWKGIDTIDIDYHHILNPSSVVNDNFIEFISFTYRVLKDCESTNIHKFRLSCPKYLSVSCLHDFVDAACSRSVQELNLDVLLGSVCELPLEFFTCKSLKVLKLRMIDYVFHVPPLADCFPNLEVLHVCFSNPTADFCERFFDGCPKLIDLMIDAGPKRPVDMCFKISATSLKKLVILLPVHFHRQFSYKFEVNAPELEHLHLRDDSMACSLVGSFTKLKRVILDLGIINLLQASPNQELSIEKRLNEVVSTQYLSLDTTNGLSRVLRYKSISTFHNLTCLRVTLHDYTARTSLYRFLKASPKLRILILRMVNKEETGEWSRPLNWPSYARDRIEKPVCLSQELKVVTMCSFRGQFVERNVIKYILECAKALCKMTIYSVDSSVKEKFSKRLLKLPRTSKDCRVEIH